MGKKSSPRQLADNEAMAYAKNIRISPQKLNLVAGCIRGMKCEKALAELRFSRRRIAGDVRNRIAQIVAELIQVFHHRLPSVPRRARSRLHVSGRSGGFRRP